ncbi:MAG: hypothetical protein WDA71_12040, partial [Actinomycetota bacterium]
AIVAGESLRGIAARFSTSAQTLLRHKPHVSAALATAQEAAQMAAADSLLDQVRSLQTRALNILDKAEQANDLRVALGAIREVRGVLELLGKVSGELVDNHKLSIGTLPDLSKLSEAELEQVAAGNFACLGL